MDFRKDHLEINNARVKQLCVIGVAAERFWDLAFHQRRGLGSCVWSDVTSVTLWDVRKKTRSGNFKRMGSCEVALTPADSQLALAVARAVCEKLEDLDFRILDAGVEQLDGEGDCVGAHDLVCERRQALGPLTGRTSVEVKLRRVTTQGLMPKMRKQVQTASWKLWPAAKADNNAAWAERLCLVVRWGPGDDLNLGKWLGMYAEVISASAPTKAPEHWKVLCGWQGQAASPEAIARAKEKAKALAKAKAQAKAQSKNVFDRLYSRCRKAGRPGKEMRSVSDLLTSIGSMKSKRARPTINQKMPVWSRKFNWTPGSWAQDEACGSRRGGGTAGYVATYEALYDIYEIVKG